MKSIKAQKPDYICKVGFKDRDGDDHEMNIQWHPLSKCYEASCEDFPKIVNSHSNLNDLIAEYIERVHTVQTIQSDSKDWEVVYYG